jgi:hypothetical protein
VAKFRYLGITLTDQNSIHEETKQLKFMECLLPFGSESFFSCLPFRNVKVKIYKTIILPVVLYGHQTWSLTLTEEHRLRVSQKTVPKRTFGPKRDKVIGESCTMGSFTICTHPHVS